MATRITTQNKNDVVTGFNLQCSIDVYKTLKGIFDGIGGDFFAIFGDTLAKMMTQENAGAMVSWLKEQVNEAEECFIEEASLSRWSGNMIDNSVCGVSGTMPVMRGNVLYMDLRIGVNRKEIMNTAKWTSRANQRPNGRNASPIIYEYNGLRMRPGVDYSEFLEDGTARIPNAAAWAGFVERAEERFWA